MLEAFGLAIADQVEPVLSRAFAIARRGQQAIDDFGICVGRVIGKKGSLFLWSRREAGEIESHPAQQSELIGRAVWRDASGFQFLANEGIDWIVRPVGQFI